MQTAELRSRFASSAVARRAIVRPDGAPHVVPVVFALVDGTVYTVIDAEPKRSRRLQQLANVRDEPPCALLVDPTRTTGSGCGGCALAGPPPSWTILPRPTRG